MTGVDGLRRRAMKDPEIELKRRLHNLQPGQNLTYEEFCLY